MKRRRSGFVYFAAAAVGVGLFASAQGCQGDSADPTGTSNEGGSASTASNSGGNGGSGASVSSSTSTSSNSGGGGSTPVSCDGDDHTVYDVTDGTLGPGLHINLPGVIAMSKKFLVSASKLSGSCLWGVYVSAAKNAEGDADLTETAENSGVLLVSYGSPQDAKGFCPLPFKDPGGDKIPDDVKPGDVLDLIGVKTTVFEQKADPPDCPTAPSPAAQLTAHESCVSISKNGTATPPTPHVMSGEDSKSLAAQKDDAFHNKWGGVKVRVENAGAKNVISCSGKGQCPTPSCEDQGAIDSCGSAYLDLEGTELQVVDDVYYVGYYANYASTGECTKDCICHSRPTFPVDTTFDSIDGFSTLGFCSWVLAPADKCSDYQGPGGVLSPDCDESATFCQ